MADHKVYSKVFIPTAGIGQRLTPYTNDINKALISVDNKPVISHIIDKFPDNTVFVIALGYKGNLVREFLELAYPNKNFIFQKIDKYEGEGSGLGHTLLQCKGKLQCPFIFVSNDTIVTDEIPLWKKVDVGNWMGYSDNKSLRSQYRTMSVEDGKVLSLHDKGDMMQEPAYIGLAGIVDYKEFWAIMESSGDAITMGESYALSEMLKDHKFNAIRFNWYDAGNKKELQKAQKELKKDNSPNILEKSDESIWFVDGKVIKYFKDKTTVKNRVARTEYLDNYVPKILNHGENMYSYEYVKGKTFTEILTPQNFKYFLNWLTEFHGVHGKICSMEELDQTRYKYKQFYEEKTYKRIAQYQKKFHSLDSDDELVNGVRLSSIRKLLNKVKWDQITSANEKKRFHGDLHFENIIVNETSDNIPFTLIDWRQDMEGNVQNGDVYYDLAKLLHGIIISHDLVDKGYYSFERNMNEIKFDFFRKNVHIECEKIFWKYAKNHGYNEYKIKIITSLIFINIAGLHHYPYCHVLYYLGKTMLHNTILEYE